VTISASISPGELTEGFPLDPAGFEADVRFTPVSVSVPEDGTAWLLAPSPWLPAAISRRNP